MSDLLNSASLVMIPSGYAEDKVYSVVPSDGSGDMTLTRASNGTRVNSAGLVEDCPWNLVKQSEQFDNAYWTKNRSSITANSTSAPNGTTTADSLIEDTANGTHEFITVLATQLQSYNFSIYAKANTRSKIQLVLAGTPWATGGNGEASFDLSLGTIISAVNGATGTIENVGNGWYRCTIAKPSSVADPSGVLAVRLLDASGNSSYTGNGTSSAYLWGAQLNIGSTAKPYFPTTDRLNVPRLTYQNGGGGCPSLLLEKQSTNYAQWSEDFSNSVWNKAGVLISSNVVNSPDGTQNASLIYPVSSGNYKYNFQIFSLSSNVYTFSIFAKAQNKNVIWLYIEDSSTFGIIYFDLNDGTMSTTAGAASTPTGTMSNMGNGWYRCTFTLGSSTSLSAGSGVGVCDAKGSPYATASSTNGVYIWGAQME